MLIFNVYLRHRVSNNRARVTELPVGRWTHDFKVQLGRLIDAKVIKGFTEHHTTESVDFLLRVRADLSDDKLRRALRLETKINLGNMIAYDADRQITRYSSAADIIDAFFPVRLDLYRQRKQLLESVEARELLVLENKHRFVTDIVAGRLDLFAPIRSRAEAVALLVDRGFDRAPLSQSNPQSASVDVPKELDSHRDHTSDYSYLLAMQVQNFNAENVARLARMIDEHKTRLDTLQRQTPEQMWLTELEQLENVLRADARYLS